MPETERACTLVTLRTAASHTGGRAAHENWSAQSVFVADLSVASDCDDPGPSRADAAGGT